MTVPVHSTIQNIMQTQFYNGKIIHTGNEAEKVHIWIFTIHQLLGSFQPSTYVPCYRPVQPGKKSTAPACKMGKDCYHIYTYCLLKNLGFLWYSDTITTTLYQDFFLKGVCGCTYRHDEDELKKIDAEVNQILSNEENGRIIIAKLTQIYALPYVIDKSKTYNGFACLLAPASVGPAQFPHFKMDSIFVYPDQIPTEHRNDIISIEDAQEALERLRKLDLSSPLWVANVFPPVQSSKAGPVIVYSTPPKKKPIPVPVPRSKAWGIASAATTMKTTVPLFPALPAMKSILKKKTPAELEVEEEERQLCAVEKVYSKVKREAETRAKHDVELRERAAAMRKKRETMEEEIAKYRENTEYL